MPIDDNADPEEFVFGGPSAPSNPTPPADVMLHGLVALMHTTPGMHASLIKAWKHHERSKPGTIMFTKEDKLSLLREMIKVAEEEREHLDED